MDLLQEISENKFVMVLLTENQYEDKLLEIVRKVEKKNTKICYVCLNKPYRDMIYELENRKIDTIREGIIFLIETPRFLNKWELH